eukprot:350065-Chlamydomonas_euryale.AAC.10
MVERGCAAGVLCCAGPGTRAWSVLASRRCRACCGGGWPLWHVQAWSMVLFAMIVILAAEDMEVIGSYCAEKPV